MIEIRQKKHAETVSCGFGSPGKIRTCDQLINSQLRYRCATGEQGKKFEVGVVITNINL
jgi:hypothetical protein